MTVTQADAGTVRDELAARVAAGDRFAGLFGSRSGGRPAGPVRARGDGGQHRHAPGAAAGRRGRLSRVHPAAGRGVLGRLDAYLLYMLIALIAVIAVVTALA